MKKELDKQLIYSNIMYMLRKRNIKISDFEKAIEVSPGFVSRLSKENAPKPSIDFLMGVSEELEISLDSLINQDFAGTSPKEAYLIDFFEILTSKTISGKQIWERESLQSLRNPGVYQWGESMHPLFKAEKILDEDYSFQYVSYFSDSEVMIPAGTFFKTDVSSETLYLTKVRKQDSESEIIELYFFRMDDDNNTSLTPLCCTDEYASKQFNAAINKLYNTVAEETRNLKVDQGTKFLIDNYIRMNQDETLTGEIDLPF